MNAILGSIHYTVKIIQKHDKAIARWISHVISPHIVGIILAGAIAVRFSDRPALALMWLAGLVPVLVLPPLGYLLWLVHRGTIEDIYMPERRTRLRPLGVLLGWLLICLGLMYYWGAPAEVQVVVWAALVLVILLGIVTLFWKISFHGAAISAAATTTVLMSGLSAWPVVLLVPLVGWARVRLQRHTVRQVIYGSLVGSLLAILLVNHYLLP